MRPIFGYLFFELAIFGKTEVASLLRRHFPPFQFCWINLSEKSSLKNMAGYKRELENKTSNGTSSSKKPRGLMRR
jgi:hypothetical protein